MMTPFELTVILGMTFVTFGIRAVLPLLSDRFDLPRTWERALTYVPPAVLTAIIVPAVLMPAGRIDVSLGNIYLLSGTAALAAGVAFRRNALWAAITAGLLLFAVLKVLPGL